MADKYEMGNMPASPEYEDAEMAMEGEDFELPEEESSPIEDLKAQLVGLQESDLKELEAAIAEELGKLEDSSEAPSEDVAPEEETPDEESGGDLSALFG